MKQLRKRFLTLLLLTLFGGAGAWAQGPEHVIQVNTELIASWENDYDNDITLADIQALGFEAVDASVAQAWTGAPSGEACLFFAFDNGEFRYVRYVDGNPVEVDAFSATKGDFYLNATQYSQYFYTGAPLGNALTSTNGTEWTLNGTPDYNLKLQVEYYPQYALKNIDTNFWRIMVEGVDKTSLVVADSLMVTETDSVSLIPANPRRVKSVTLGGDALAGNWYFHMPGAKKVLDVVLYDSIVLGPHVAVASHPVPDFVSYTRGDSTILYYDPALANSSFSFEAADDDGEGRNFTSWADDLNNSSTYRPFTDYNDITFRFAYNSELQITATPTAGNHLSAWSNEVSVANPAGATQTITLVRDTVVRAFFVPNPHVAISVNNDNMGTIEIIENENATLLDNLTVASAIGTNVKAQTSAGYTPAGNEWVSADPAYVQVLPVNNQNAPDIHHAVAYNAGGDSAVFDHSDYTNSITIRLKNGKAYAENDIMFSTPLMEGGITHINVYSVDASMPEGLTQVSEGVYQVPEGTSVSIRATRALGHYLSAWSNGVEVADRASDVQRIVVIADTAISATFALNPYLYVAASPADAGTVSIANNAGVTPYGHDTYGVVPGTKFIATATPAAAYHLTGWSTGSPNIEYRKDTVVMGSEELTLTALFDTNSYVLTVAVADGQDAMGSVQGDNDAAKHFRDYEISATGNHGYRFSQWSDGNTDNPRSVSLTKDSTFTASFVLDTFTLAIAVSHEQMGGASLLATNDVEWDEALLQTPDFSSNANNPFVSQQISLTANEAMFSSEDWATFNGAVLGAGDMSSLKFTAPAGHNFSKIEIAASNFNEFEAGNGWTRSGDFAIWSGAPVHDVLLNTTLLGVTQITFTLDTILPAGVVADGNGAYRMPYMTSGVLRDIPLRGHHFVEWKEADTTYSTDAQVAVQALGNRTLTAHFAANPVLTLTSSAHGVVAVENTVSSTIANVRYTELRGGEMLRVGDTIMSPREHGRLVPSISPTTATPSL